MSSRAETIHFGDRAAEGPARRLVVADFLEPKAEYRGGKRATQGVGRKLERALGLVDGSPTLPPQRFEPAGVTGDVCLYP